MGTVLSRQVTDDGWFPFAWAVVPIVVGIAVFWLSRRRPDLGSHPPLVAIGLFLVLLVLSAADTPGGDLVTPVLGMLVSAAVSIGIFVGLRRLSRG